ncbi:MAG: hypothetical protein OXC40_05125 [Proteobacteria bacterium]|nr:hypothetical protein [Pseudomonadota bacterium]
MIFSYVNLKLINRLQQIVTIVDMCVKAMLLSFVISGIPAYSATTVELTETETSSRIQGSNPAEQLMVKVSVAGGVHYHLLSESEFDVLNHKLSSFVDRTSSEGYEVSIDVSPPNRDDETRQFANVMMISVTASDLESLIRQTSNNQDYDSDMSNVLTLLKATRDHIVYRSANETTGDEVTTPEAGTETMEITEKEIENNTEDKSEELVTDAETRDNNTEEQGLNNDNFAIEAHLGDRSLMSLVNAANGEKILSQLLDLASFSEDVDGVSLQFAGNEPIFSVQSEKANEIIFIIYSYNPQTESELTEETLNPAVFKISLADYARVMLERSHQTSNLDEPKPVTLFFDHLGEYVSDHYEELLGVQPNTGGQDMDKVNSPNKEDVEKSENKGSAANVEENTPQLSCLNIKVRSHVNLQSDHLDLQSPSMAEYRKKKARAIRSALSNQEATQHSILRSLLDNALKNSSSLFSITKVDDDTIRFCYEQS